ncbi:MAG: hypothetical protein JST89_19475 [Cyanobacteria bacterium SZAS-4]|nr:hypothetical protein [Cyanobacteria bacterium SZAS-4]
MATEDFNQQLKTDKDKGQIDNVVKDIYKQLADDFPKSGQDGSPYTTDYGAAKKFLQDNKLLPGLELIGLDDKPDKNGVGLQVTDSGSGHKETYTIDPNTGIGRSNDGLIQAMVMPDGKIQRFEYSADGKLTGVIDGSGKSYTIDQTTGKSKYYDEANEQWVTTPGKFSLDQKTGAITITNDNGTREVHQVDGSIVKYNDNQKDKDGNPLVVEVGFAYDPTNKNSRGTMKFDYDKDGNLTSVRDQQGATWTKNADNKWQSDKVGADGKPIVSDADFSVDNQGAVTIRHKNSRETYHADGSKEKVTMVGDPVTSTVDVITDRAGHLTEIKGSNGSNIKVTYNGDKESVVVTPDGTYTRKENTWEFKDNENKVSTVISVNAFAADGSVVISTAEGQIVYKNGTKTFVPSAKQGGDK